MFQEGAMYLLVADFFRHDYEPTFNFSIAIGQNGPGLNESKAHAK
jgi:hypothetical protein